MSDPNLKPCPRCGALVSEEDAAIHAEGHDAEDQDAARQAEESA